MVTLLSVLLAATPVVVTERWVDASALDAGDGSRVHPYKTLGPALAVGASPRIVHLASGMYPGPFELPDQTELVGEGTPVLHGEGDVVVSVRGTARLSHLWIQGGMLGLESLGHTAVDQVHFSGQRGASVRVRSGSFQAVDSRFEASVSETRGVMLEATTVGDFTRCHFVGPYRRAVEVRSARASLEGSRFEGPAVGVHQVGGEVRVRRSTFEGGRGPALFVSAGALHLEESEVRGHEYAVQSGAGARVELDRLSSFQAEAGGLALVGTRGKISGLVVSQSGGGGAVQLYDSDIELLGARIDFATSVGILSRKGRLVLSQTTLSRMRVDAPSDPKSGGGDGVMLRDAEVSIDGLWVRGAAGAGVVATAGASVRLKDVLLEDCQLGGVVAERGAQVEAVGLSVRGSPGAAVVVPDRAELRVDLLDVERCAGGPVWAECGEGAAVLLSRPRQKVPPAACLGRWEHPKLSPIGNPR